MRQQFFAIFLLFLLNVKSQNNLRIYSANGELFKLSINTILINEHEDANVLVQNIIDDTVVIQIEFFNKLKAEKKVFLVEKGKTVINREFNYKVENVKNKLVISFVNLVKENNSLTHNSPFTKSQLNQIQHFLSCFNG